MCVKFFDLTCARLYPQWLTRRIAEVIALGNGRRFARSYLSSEQQQPERHRREGRYDRQSATSSQCERHIVFGAQGD